VTTTFYSCISSPLGPLLLLGRRAADPTDDPLLLTGLYMRLQKYRPGQHPDWQQDDALFASVARQLEAYFAGDCSDFSVQLALSGTAFQRQVWQGLQAIPHGTTISYGELARRLGVPGAARAVGLANGHNPVGIIVPCHRVIGANGALTGYGGGLDRKRWLLDHEQRHGGQAQASLSPDW
jgi:methylated-DNA-[protein]-cysteine S-methyltransferase